MPMRSFFYLFSVVGHTGPHLGLLATAHELLDLDPFGAQDAALQHLLWQGLSFLWKQKQNI